jgi:nitrile hydratase beta subunit
MDGMHDLGGKQGFGRIAYPPVPHDESWEPLVRALWILGVRSGLYNMDEYRHAIERMEPRHYLSASYYERSLTSLATLCVEKGIVTREELERRAHGTFPLALPSAPGRSNVAARERFEPGDRVKVSTDQVPGHVRMPAYVRGKVGVVVNESPAYPFPDAHAHGVEAADEPTFDVRFKATDLWPNTVDEAFVHVGIFQSYLERAD